MAWQSLRVFRSVLFWTHLTAGAVAAVVILIMSVTGVLLTYQRQMQYWADTRHFRAEPAVGESRLPADALVAQVEAAVPGDDRATTVTYRATPSLPVAVAIGSKTFYANPYTGHVYGEGTGQRMRAFFTSMVSWHRYVAMTGEQRPTGRAITGAANMLFLFIVLSGMYLWWPKSLTWTQIRNITWFRRGLPGKARDFNWHNTLGFWSAIPLAIVVYSGAVISYPWVSNGVYRMMGEEPPRPTASGPGSAGPGSRVQEIRASLEGAIATASARVADWKILTLRVPANTSASTTVTMDRGDGGQPHLRDTLTIETATGAIASWAPFSEQTAGRRMRSYLRFAHTGEVLGLTGQTVAGLVSAIAVVLVYTGLALSIRRFFGWLVRRRRQNNPLATTKESPRAA